MLMANLIEVRPIRGYRLWLRYDDGAEGEIDLSDEVGIGVFSFWNDPKNFQKVSIGQGGQLSWSEDVDICADAMYLEITGRKPEDIFPALSKVRHVARD